MKLFTTLLLAALALPALANQPYRGPLLSRDIGKEHGNLGLISTCQLLGNHPDIKWADVRKDIAQAIKDAENPNNFDKHVYAKFNAPSKLYVAYWPVEKANTPPKLEQVELFSDGGSYSALKTDAGKRLLKVITENCGPLKRPQGGLEKAALTDEPSNILESFEFKPNGEFKD